MATTKPVKTMAQMEAESAALAQAEQSLANTTDQSASFWSNTANNNTDIQNDLRLRDLKARQEKLKSNIISQNWYGIPAGEDFAASSKPKEGIISKGLNTLAKPLYGLVGAASYVAGKGTGSLSDSMMSGIENRETWGGLLKRSGVTPGVASTLGFGLDVLTDPLNIFTGGWAGLQRTALGKVVVGAKAAGTKGVAAALKSTGAKAAYNLSKIVMPGISIDKSIGKALVKMEKAGITKDSPLFIEAVGNALAGGNSNTILGKTLGKMKLTKDVLKNKVMKTSDAFDTIVGWDLMKKTDARALRASATETVIGEIKKIPGAEKVVNVFEMDPHWFSQVKMLDYAKAVVAKASGNPIIKRVFDPSTGEMVSPPIEETMKRLASVSRPLSNYLPASVLSNDDILKNMQSLIDEGSEVLEYSGKLEVPGTVVSAAALAEESGKIERLGEYMKAIEDTMRNDKVDLVRKLNDVIVKKFKIKNTTAAEKIMDAYDIGLGAFVTAKISLLSPSSMFYAAVGNPTMALMFGFDPTHPDNFKRLGDAMSIVFKTNKTNASNVLTWMKQDPAMADFLNVHSSTFVDIFGINPSSYTLEDVADTAAKEAIIKGAKEGSGTKLERAALEAGVLSKRAKENTKGILNKIKSKDWDTIGAQTVEEGHGAATGFFQNETAGLKGFQKLKGWAKETAVEGEGVAKVAAKAANFALKMSQQFQKIDQTYKLQYFFRMVRDGLPEKEIIKITNNFMATNARILASDYAGAYWKNGVKYFRLKPLKAMEISNDVFMNYAAMPAFVQALRKLPMGSPFFAFTYAMLDKTGKAVLNNPASFNKITFLLDEFTKDKSPVEREALKSKYYSYLNEPGMVNLGENMPFFKGHPIYLNLAQMIPYYSLSIINPSDRGFDSTAKGQLATAIDKSPFFKDPLGQVLLDYFVLPAIMQDQNPVNMWGGPLYEKGASGWKQGAYAGRSLAEAFIPSSVGTAMGLGMAAINKTPEAQTLVPSYPGRKVGNAVLGRTALGITGKEDPMSRGMRALLSQFGINLYPVDLTNIANEIKKRQ